ncbi:MAG: T9SS type A sorting domain-containing protein [Elusimicrobia bacterium]|nr:T9SS type A sorting domain-containing protein [Elusimicrobiota bacterium]
MKTEKKLYFILFILLLLGMCYLYSEDEGYIIIEPEPDPIITPVDDTPPVPDTTPPTGSIIVNNGNPLYVNSINVTLCLTYSDAGSGVDTVRYSNDNSVWTSWESPSATKIWQLVSGDSLKTVYYEVKDKAGNVAQFNDTITIDATLPTGSITINNNNPDNTDSVNVTLYLTYSDNGSGIDMVRYSNDNSIWTSWESASAVKNWQLVSGDGVKTVYYEVKDNAGNVTQFTDTIILKTFIPDTTPPIASILINNNAAYTNSIPVTITISASDPESGITGMKIWNTGNTEPAAWEPYAISKNWNLTSEDGIKTINVKFKNGQGLETLANDTISLDTSLPAGSIVINSGNPEYTNSINVTLCLTYSDNSSGVDMVRYGNSGDFWTPWELPSATKSWQLASGEGVKTVYYQVKDKAGNITQLTDTIIFKAPDTTPPIASVLINNNADYTNTLSVTLTISAADPETGITGMKIWNTGNTEPATWEPYATSKNWSLTSENGIKTVNVKLKNGQELETLANDTITLDTILPAGSIAINNNNPDNTDSVNVTLYLTYSDNGSGVDMVRYGNSGDVWTSWELPSATKIWQLTSGEGVKTVYYHIKDKAGNVTQLTDTITFKVPDTTPPIASVLINNNAAYTNTISIILTLSAVDNESGITGMKIWNTGNTEPATWEPYAISKNWNLTSEDGIKTVNVKFKNGQELETLVNDTISLDTILPAGSIVINSGNPEYTNSIDVTLYLTNSDSGSGVDMVRYGNDSDVWTPWELPSATKIWKLTSDNDIKTVYYEIKDKAGNVTQFSDTISLDTTPPSGSIVINNSNPEYTNSIDVTLCLTYSDTDSDIDTVRYSNDNSIWTSWESPFATKNWKLVTGDGVKTVYYEVKDKAGNVAQFTDTISLDTSLPAGSIVINNSNPEYTDSVDVTLSLTYSDNGSGVDMVRYGNDGDVWTVWELASATKIWKLTSGDGLKTVYYEVKDKSGNIAQFSDTITLETIIAATIDINPNTLNLKSKGNWITAYIELPIRYNVQNINISSLLLNDKISAEQKSTSTGDHDSDGIPDLMVKFSREEAQKILCTGEDVTLTLTGSLVDGKKLIASDTIRVIEPGKGPKESEESKKTVEVTEPEKIENPVEVKNHKKLKEFEKPKEPKGFEEPKKIVDITEPEKSKASEEPKVSEKPVEPKEPKGFEEPKKIINVFEPELPKIVEEKVSEKPVEPKELEEPKKIVEVSIPEKDKNEPEKPNVSEKPAEYKVIEEPKKIVNITEPEKPNTPVVSEKSVTVTLKEKEIHFVLAQKLPETSNILEAVLWLGLKDKKETPEVYYHNSFQNKYVFHNKYMLKPGMGWDITGGVTEDRNQNKEISILVKFNEDIISDYVLVVVYGKESSKEKIVVFSGGNIVLPAGLNSEITMKENAEAKPIPQNLKPISRTFEPSEKIELTKEAVITLSYNDVVLNDTNEKDLKIFYYDEKESKWQPLANCEVNVSQKNISAKTTKLSTFQIMAPVIIKTLAPLKSQLGQNYPNPFNPATTINYSIERDCHVSLKLYNVVGELVATIVDEFKTAGKYSVYYDGGAQLSRGIYYYQIIAGSFVNTKKMVVLK